MTDRPAWLDSIPGPCPVCGGISIAPAVQRSTLLATCNVLTLKALEKLGNYLLRSGRSKYREVREIARHEVYLSVPASADQVERVLVGAWDVIPAQLADFGCSGVSAAQVQAMLDGYVRDLVAAQAHHRIDLLRERFHDRLGLPVFDREPETAGR